MPPEEEEQQQEEQQSAGPRPFWSGTISFGLVSIPVSLFPANRAGGVPLRMLAPDGTPLARRYYCAKDDQPVDDDVVRGFEVDDGEYVIVTDEELDALAPEKSRDIDLRELVPAASVDPMYFERGYYLAPDEASSKAYRLLADVMERKEKAGIATFVMRGKEYLVAIFAERGILRAETLRFADELRSADELGVPKHAKADEKELAKIEKAIAKLEAERFDPSELEDERVERLKKLVHEKQKHHRDVVEAAEAAEGETEKPIDLIRALSQSLQGQRRGPSPARRPARGGRTERPLEKQTKQQLAAVARKLGIEAARRMTKDELVRAIRRAGHAA